MVRSIEPQVFFLFHIAHVPDHGPDNLGPKSVPRPLGWGDIMVLDSRERSAQQNFTFIIPSTFHTLIRASPSLGSVLVLNASERSGTQTR